MLFLGIRNEVRYVYNIIIIVYTVVFLPFATKAVVICYESYKVASKFSKKKGVDEGKNYKKEKESALPKKRPNTYFFPRPFLEMTFDTALHKNCESSIKML